MIFFPSAKINIGLRITKKRPDGYHDIETIFYPVELCDALEFVVSDNQEQNDIIRVTGTDAEIENDDNLVMKAVLKLREKRTFPFLKVHLHKGIPLGAGLGGGSSDAACMLKVINRHFGLHLDKSILKSLALELGSDCSFFIDCEPSVAAGRGEILTPVRNILSGYYLVLINPGVEISTREAYQNCHPAVPATSLLRLIELPVAEWKNHILNDFEEFAFKKFPIIGELKSDLYSAGALFSLMSGSGSSVYGVFSEKPALPEKVKKYVIWEGLM